MHIDRNCIRKLKPIDLFKDLSKNFLNSNDKAVPNILLLIGQAGIGKSFFCRRLQRDLLHTWSHSLGQKPEENLWLPVHIDCSQMGEFEVDAIAKTLKQKLHMTEEMVKILQAPEVCNIARPNLLFIFDGCDTAVQILLEEFFTFETDFQKYNIPYIIRAEKFNTVKLLITCREETLHNFKRREMLFAPTQGNESPQRCLNTQLFLQRRIEPFSNGQITRYLIKCYYCGLLQTYRNIESREDTNPTNLTQDPEYSQDFKDFKEFKYSKDSEDSEVSEESEQLSKRLSSSSGPIVKTVEKIIDSYKLREIARTPFMLKIIVELLPRIVTEHTLIKRGLLHSNNLAHLLLIERFIDEAIYSNARLGITTSSKKESEKNTHEQEEKNQNIRPFNYRN